VGLSSHTSPDCRTASPGAEFSYTGLRVVYAGDAADAFVGARPGDDRVRGIIGLAREGVVYTGGTKKIAEHGGDHAEDRHVLLVVSGAGARHGATVLRRRADHPDRAHDPRAAGLDPTALQAVRIEHTPILR